MKKLQRATIYFDPVQQISHRHVVFTNELRGYGLSSVDEGHQHQLQWVPPVPEQPEQPPGMDPNTGQPTPGMPAQPAQPGYWQWSPGPDGHVHEGFEEIPVKYPKLKEDDETQVVAETVRLFNAWFDNDRLSIQAGQESEDYYSGNQWPTATRSALESQSRACLTINRIANRIDTLSGYERKQRTEIRYVPQEGGDQRAADMYNLVVKQALDKCNFWQEKTASFEDMIICGKGSWNIRVSRDDDLRGDIIVERFPWDQSVYAPAEKPDASDAEGFCKYRWYSLARAKLNWPDKADDMDAKAQMVTLLPSELDKTRPGEQKGKFGQQMVGSDLTPIHIDVERKNILVVECHRQMFIEVPVLGHYQEDFYQSAYGWQKYDIEATRTIQGFTKIIRNIKKIRITKIAGGSVLLSDELPADLPSDDFHFISFYARRKRGQYWGKVEQTKDVQLQINKCASQMVDIGNRMASYNWFVDKDTFPDNELNKFVKTSATPGAVFEVNNLNKIPVKSEGVKFPNEIVSIMQLHDSTLDQMMNIVPEAGGANESGAAILQKTQLQMTGNEYLFEALSNAMTKLGRLMIPIIKKYYPPERVVRIVRNQNLKSPVQIGPDPLDDFTDEEIVEILSQNDIEKFDLVVGESNYSPTARLGNYLILTDLAAKGVQVPPEMIIKYSDMSESDKEKLMQSIQQQTDAQNQATATAGDAEIEKTLVAKNIIPPSVAQRFGIPSTVNPQSDGSQMQATMGGGLEDASMQQPQEPQAPQQPQQQMPPMNINIQPPSIQIPPMTVQIDGRQPGMKQINFVHDPVTGRLVGGNVTPIGE